LLEELGGGLLYSGTKLDLDQGELEFTGQRLDMSVMGKGFFQVDDHGAKRLTRDGRMTLDHSGKLVTQISGLPVMDKAGKPISIDPAELDQININDGGEITLRGDVLATLGVVDAVEPNRLVPHGQGLYEYDGKSGASNGSVKSGYLERANVDPAAEMTQMMDAERQLEANANMIRFQDQSLSTLVNNVGKIG
jgi:flagellar basal body rod protein FlgG